MSTCDQVTVAGLPLPHTELRGIQGQALALLAAFEPCLGFAARERHADCGVEFRSLAGFQQVAEGQGRLRALESFRIGVGGEEDHRDTGLFVQRPRGSDPVLIPFDMDVHQHQIGPLGDGQRQRLFRVGRRPDDLVAKLA